MLQLLAVTRPVVLLVVIEQAVTQLAVAQQLMLLTSRIRAKYVPKASHIQYFL
jgi:hypothetical protein